MRRWRSGLGAAYPLVDLTTRVARFANINKRALKRTPCSFFSGRGRLIPFRAIQIYALKRTSRGLDPQTKCLRLGGLDSKEKVFRWLKLDPTLYVSAYPVWKNR
jgi:hypothetical protein